MKVQVTHLKAPWPKGTKVDAVVRLEGDALPAWAIGKCRVLGGDPDEQEQKAEGKKQEQKAEGK